MKKRAASFKKSERLCSVKAISELFAEGRTINISSLRILYRIRPVTGGVMPVRVLITVPRRHFKKAVDRNLMRRRLREAWRKNKEPLFALMKEKGRTADIALIWTDIMIRPYDYTEKCIKEAIARVSGLKY
ncbi:MAG: ribonuclease P protein component [Actinomycetota bacterium]|jgi:ribonuclease P protein component